MSLLRNKQCFNKILIDAVLYCTLSVLFIVLFSVIESYCNVLYSIRNQRTNVSYNRYCNGKTHFYSNIFNIFLV